jgi:preprotein translocase subunit SecA
MNFNALISAFFGNKASRDIKKIQPLVEKVKAAYPAIQALSNDELRAKTKEIQSYIQNSANDLKKQIEELKAKQAELYAKCKRSSSQTAHNNSSSTITLIEKSGKRKHPFDPENIERCKHKI